VRKEEGGERRAVGEWREVERRKEEGSCADGGGRREERGKKGEKRPDECSKIHKSTLMSIHFERQEKKNKL
jgi:hypothetical protein